MLEMHQQMIPVKTAYAVASSLAITNFRLARLPWKHEAFVVTMLGPYTYGCTVLVETWKPIALTKQVFRPKAWHVSANRQSLIR